MGSPDRKRSLELVALFDGDDWADEIMVPGQIFDHDARLQSYSLLAQAYQQIGDSVTATVRDRAG